MKKPLFLTTAAVCLSSCFYINAPGGGHRCYWEDCDMTGDREYSTIHEEGTDAYYFGLTHFAHPGWTYEQVEQYVFGGEVRRDPAVSAL